MTKPGRFLFVSPGSMGHAGPELAVAKRLLRRGHEVALCAPPVLAERIESTGVEFVPLTTYEAPRQSATEGPAELAARIARCMGSPAIAEEVAGELDRRRPDVAAVDVMMSAAFVATEAAGSRTACVFPILYQPWLSLYQPWLPWYGELMGHTDEARARLGLPPWNGRRWTAVPEHARLTLVLSDLSFDLPATERLDRRVRYVGRAIDPDPVSWRSPWPPDDPRPLVVFSLSGSFPFQHRQTHQIVEELGRLPVRVLFLHGGLPDASDLRIPENTVVEGWAPHEAVLPEAALVVTNGGHNTILGALAHGVPVLVSPLMHEQTLNGARAAAVGGGIVLLPEAGAEAIREALEWLLFDPQARDGARRASRDLSGDGGERAVDALERLLRRRRFAWRS